MKSGHKIGLALCGSYCTYEKVLAAAERLAGECELTAIMSETAAATDSRFGKAENFIDRLEQITGKPVIKSITDAERVGPGKLFDVIVVAPCTGNTLAKLANGITDTAVTMAVKAQLRNGRPVVIAMSTNDALSGGAANVAALMNRKNYYFVPFGQDDPVGKPTSLAADFGRIEETVEAALEGRQVQPLLLK
ncbi:MAG: dipicolinate synthase subunit B [Clostridia bacterium]|nr:dipicolinate synthase subunit B [Clostridia bacterium]